MTSEVLKQAIEAMKIAQDNLRPHGDNCVLHDEGEYNRCFCGKDSLSDHLQSVVESLEEALNQEQDELVAWEYEEYRHAITGQMEWFPEVDFVQPPNEPTLFRKIKPLYTTPQLRKPLTFEQVEDCFGDGVIAEENGILISAQWLHDFARAIESAHGIKE